VVIPVFNNVNTIGATIESALAQRFDRGFEIVVVNDGSTDGTREVIAKFADRIRVVDQENLGLSAARNSGIHAAAGEYIALLDGDDTWTEDKLAKTVPVLDTNPQWVGVFSDAIQVDGSGNLIREDYVPSEYTHAPTLDEMIAWPWPILPSAMVIRKATLHAIGGFSEEFGRRGYGGEDVYAFLLARELGEIHFVPDKLVRYRLSDFNENLSKRLADWQRRGSDLDPGSLFEGYGIFARLMRERYGARGETMARLAERSQRGGLVGLGLMAMHTGNRSMARRCYLASLRYPPLDPKTWVRLAWAVLPDSIARPLTSVLTPRLRRSLSGPPFHVLHDRPLKSG
jgi:glycosyltransferase involved in cell wall biosynthesis